MEPFGKKLNDLINSEGLSLSQLDNRSRTGML